MTPRIDKPDHHRVVVTGIGLVTSVGGNRETSWQALLAGQSGVRRLNGIRVSRDEPAYGARALGPRPEDDGEPVHRLALAASDEALADSGLELGPTTRDRIGCVVGTSKGGLSSLRRAAGRSSHDPETGRLWSRFLPHSTCSAIGSRHDLRGPSTCPVAACATGLLAVLKASEYIRDGYCDAVLAGSADASLEPAVLAAFHRMGVLAKVGEDPAEACRPFDANRNGFLVGEGAAMFVVESLAHARRRGAPIYAEFLAGAALAEARDVTHLDPEAEVLGHLITSVLRGARLAPDELGYINLHGTATRQNDVYETRALKQALGRAAWHTPLSGTKSMIGHTLGAAGGIELAVCLLALRDGIIPPTINLNEPDPQCDLDYTPAVARRRQVDTAMKISLGFGGHLVGAALRRLAPCKTAIRTSMDNRRNPKVEQSS